MQSTPIEVSSYNLRNPEPRPGTRDILSGYGGRPSLRDGGKVDRQHAGRTHRPAKGRRAAKRLPFMHVGACRAKRGTSADILNADGA